jgi:hypothetical protein
MENRIPVRSEIRRSRGGDVSGGEGGDPREGPGEDKKAKTAKADPEKPWSRGGDVSEGSIS